MKSVKFSTKILFLFSKQKVKKLKKKWGQFFGNVPLHTQSNILDIFEILFQELITKSPAKKQLNHHHHNFSKSPNHQFFQVLITKSPIKKQLNHHHHNFSRSPNHQFFQVQITKSPTKKQPNHQSPKILASPLREGC